MRNSMRSAIVLLPFLFIFVAPNVFAQLSGSWSGTYTAVSSGCQPPVPHGGALTFDLSETGSAVSGTISIEVFLFDCRTADEHASVASQTQTVTFTGTAAGNSFSASFPAGPQITGTVSGTLTGDEIVLTFAFGDTTGTGHAFRQGSAAADVDGTWSGQYTAVATYCTPPVAMSGTVTAELSQSGNAVSGLLTIQTPYYDCDPDPRSATATVQGSVTAHSLSASFDARPTRAWPVGNVRATLDGNALIVSFVSGDTTGTATLSRVVPRRRAVRH